MSRFKNRQKEMNHRISALEQKRDQYYDQSALLENDIDEMNRLLIEKREKIVDWNKKAENVDSYVGFLEKQLLVESLEQLNYSLENFDGSEQDRLLFALRNENDQQFKWYVQKKQQGFFFGGRELLYKIMKEDYEEFCKELEETEE